MSEEQLQEALVIINCPDAACKTIRKMARRYRVIGVSCESIDHEIILLQVATQDGKIYIFDVYACPELMTCGNLGDLLQSNTVAKVIHDCRELSAMLYEHFGVELQHVFDIKVALDVIQKKEAKNPLASEQGSCSLHQINRDYGRRMLIPEIERGLATALRKDPDLWKKRPIKKKTAVWASFKASCIVPEVYNNLLDRIGGDMAGFRALVNRNLKDYSGCRTGELRERTMIFFAGQCNELIKKLYFYFEDAMRDYS